VAVEPRIERHGPLESSFPGVEFFKSLDDALADDEVRAAVIATPVETHAALARQALEAGRHVLVEKPLASSVADAEALADLAEEKDLTLMVGHTFLFSPRVKAIKEAIQSGQTGQIHYVTSSRLNLGIHRSDVNVIWDLAAHDFSIVFHLLGEFPNSVHSLTKGVARATSPDVAFMTLTFPSGAVASVDVSWLAPRKVRNTTIVAEKCMIMYDDTQAEEPVKIYDRGLVTPESADFAEHQMTYRTGSTVAPAISAQEPLSLELEHFVERVQQGGDAMSNARFGVEVVRALEAADESWRYNGIRVAIDPSPGWDPALG
jgi:predicted dehydrogenase